MLNHADLTKLEHSLRDRTVLSVYINGENSNAASRAQWRTELRNALDAIGELLDKAPHAEREAFAATRELALSNVDDYEPGEDTPGWMGLFTPREVHHAGVRSRPRSDSRDVGEGCQPRAMYPRPEGSPPGARGRGRQRARAHSSLCRSNNFVRALP